MLPYYVKGFGLGAGLIVAIGAQNAHVLRMGLLRQHVAATVAVCIVCEAILIAAGVAGIGTLVERNRLLMAIARWGGAAFLLWYGIRAWRSALVPQALAADLKSTAPTTRRALAAVLAVTLLNPHVYLDTVILLGSLAGQQGSAGKWWFAAGAMSSGALWFMLLGFGARLLSPWFTRPRAWRLLDGMVGMVMLLLAAGLVLKGG